jgi:predicted dehydrogenase
VTLAVAEAVWRDEPQLKLEGAVRRCLFVGLGGIGQRHLRNLRQLLGKAVDVHAYRVRREQQTLDDSLQVVPNLELEQTYDVKVSTELDAAFDVRPDVVFITNPTSLHVPVAQLAAERGCHLFIEKPLSHELDGVRDLLALCDRRRLTTCVAYQLRHHPGFLRLQTLLAQSAVGRVLTARAEVAEYLPGFHPYEDYRRMYAAQSALGGGVTLSQIHEIDYLIALFGAPRRVFSMGGHVSSLEVDVDDVALSLLEFARPDGGPLYVELHQDFVQRPGNRSATIVGERGKIEWSLSGKSLKYWDENGHLLEAHDYSELPRNATYLAELRQFLDAVSLRQPCTPSLRDGAASLEVALALLQSQTTGKAVIPAGEFS